MRNQGERKKKG